MSHISRPTKFWTLTVLGGAALLVYLFATAPTALESAGSAQKTMSTQEALTLLALENDITRTLFTKEIVGKGKAHGLKFDEDWADEDVIAGPLPALFLRGVAGELAVSDVPLGLFLGSDFPIESSNGFEGRQMDEFKAMRQDLLPRHFIDEATGEHVSMFPDFASAGPCVSCHNEHTRTSKSDWQLGDLMGATTWSYPSDSVTTDEFLAMLGEYRKGVEVVWGQYLSELDQLDPEMRPHIGDEWPSQGLFIPAHAALRDSIDRMANGALFLDLLNHTTL
jgi:hypothetical protein